MQRNHWLSVYTSEFLNLPVKLRIERISSRNFSNHNRIIYASCLVNVASSDWAVHFIAPDGKTRIGPWLLHESHDQVLMILEWCGSFVDTAISTEPLDRRVGLAMLEFTQPMDYKRFTVGFHGLELRRSATPAVQRQDLSNWVAGLFPYSGRPREPFESFSPPSLSEEESTFH